MPVTPVVPVGCPLTARRARRARGAGRARRAREMSVTGCEYLSSHLHLEDVVSFDQLQQVFLLGGSKSNVFWDRTDMPKTSKHLSRHNKLPDMRLCVMIDWLDL